MTSYISLHIVMAIYSYYAIQQKTLRCLLALKYLHSLWDRVVLECILSLPTIGGCRSSLTFAIKVVTNLGCLVHSLGALRASPWWWPLANLPSPPLLTKGSRFLARLLAPESGLMLFFPMVRICHLFDYGCSYRTMLSVSIILYVKLSWVRSYFMS